MEPVSSPPAPLAPRPREIPAGLEGARAGDPAAHGPAHEGPQGPPGAARPSLHGSLQTRWTTGRLCLLEADPAKPRPGELSGFQVPGCDTEVTVRGTAPWRSCGEEASGACTRPARWVPFPRVLGGLDEVGLWLGAGPRCASVVLSSLPCFPCAESALAQQTERLPDVDAAGKLVEVRGAGPQCSVSRGDPAPAEFQGQEQGFESQPHLNYSWH